MEKVYEILIKDCGANQEQRLNFLAYMTNSDLPLEWRFIGKLGFGGKLYKQGKKMYVSCYPEDLNPERQEIINSVNEKLKAII